MVHKYAESRRRARRAHVERKRAAGLVQLRGWVTPDEAALVEVTLIRHRGELGAVPTICQKCAHKGPPDGQFLPPPLPERLASWPGVRYRNPHGCESCRQEDDSGTIHPEAGYSHRTPSDPGGEDWDDRLWCLVAVGEVDPLDALRFGVDPETAPDEAPISALAMVAVTDRQENQE